MWFDEQKPVVDGHMVAEWLRPLFTWFTKKIVKPVSDQWRYDLAKWAMDPLITISKPKWFTQLVVTLCTEPKDVQQPK